MKHFLSAHSTVLLKKLSISLAILLLFTSFFLGAFVQKALAQIPPPGEIPCRIKEDPEFHSHRPYQKSPLNECIAVVDDTARFCGNDLLLTDTVNVNKSQAVSCRQIGPHTEECIFDISRDYEVAIDLSGVELPIIGNTENVPNSQEFNPDPNLNDAERVNEYLGWYLNGAFVKPEEEYNDPESEEGARQLVDYSGPIRKLLPVDEIHRRQTYSVLASITNKRHNQIVVCAETRGGKKTPVECYKKEGGEAQKEYRLEFWRGQRIPSLVVNTVIDLYLRFLPLPLRLLIDEEQVEKDIGNIWTYKVPPLPEDYEENIYYQKAYKEWQGNVCVVFTMPITGYQFLLCMDHPALINTYADLFPFVPLSSYETSTNNPSSRTDREGKARGYVPSEQQHGEIRVYDIELRDQQPAELFFPHVQETSGLAQILQTTFVPSGEATTGEETSIQPAPFCDLTEVRTNPGDDLFPGEIKGHMYYSAEFPCEFETAVETGRACTTRQRCPDRMNCIDGKCWTRGNTTCTKHIPISMSVITFTPKADELWQRLVAGPAGVFKRIFPKITQGAPVESILDIPAATNVTYTGDHLASVGNPGNQRDDQSAELYWPHFGSIHEYFLGCIQSILRPQGFGDVCSTGELSSEPVSCEGVPDADISGIEGGRWLGLMKENYLNLADRWSEKCPGPENNLAEECYNFVVSESHKAGINPAMPLSIWLQEGGSSNYCMGTIFDFGYDKAGFERNVPLQLENHLRLAGGGYYKSCRDDSSVSWIEPMQAYIHMHRTGVCDPNNGTGIDFYNDIKSQAWTWVTEPLATCVDQDGKFKITWPDDRSCP